MRQLWSDRGTTGAVAISVENGDAPIKNWKGVAVRDFPLATKSIKLDGAAVDKYITKKLSCGDCPMPCKGIVAVKSRGLRDVRRPDYETIAGFGAALLNDDLEVVTACHDACNRYGLDAVSASATIAWVCEAVEEGVLTPKDLDGIDMRWGNGEGALALTIKMGTGEGCGAWLRHGSARAAAHVGKGSERFAVHVHGQEPAYHDSRFTSLMGVTYIADPTPGRHTAGSASWNETFNSKFPIPNAVDPRGDDRLVEGHRAQGRRAGPLQQRAPGDERPRPLHVHQPDGRSPVARSGERAHRLEDDRARPAARRRAHPEPPRRLQPPRGNPPGRLQAPPADARPGRRQPARSGPLAGITVPLQALKDDYYRAMGWNPETGALARSRARRAGHDRAPRGLRRGLSVLSALKRLLARDDPGGIRVHVLLKGRIGSGLVRRRRAGAAAGGRDARGPARRRPTAAASDCAQAIADSPHLRHTLILNGDRCPVDENLGRALADGDEIYLLAPLAGG